MLVTSACSDKIPQNLMAYNQKHLFLTHVACGQRQVNCGSVAWPVALLNSYWLCFASLVFLILGHGLKEFLRQGLPVSGQKNVQKAKPNHTTILKTFV